jgi:phosphatidylglycerol:prolipoprotein diacylglycerol transferase
LPAPWDSVFSVHLAFDMLAAGAALLVTLAMYYWWLAEAGQRIERAGPLYPVALLAGAAVGGFGAGTLNLWLSGEAGIARSVVGALAGAIAGVELFKHRRGIKESTGLLFVAGLATSIMVGRWGCFLSGLDDYTHGTPTALPWGHDFGDGVSRHPVQLYESAVMALFLLVTFALIVKRNRFFLANGFYLFVLVYASQRFAWEFLKPYASVLGPFNLFHLICAALIIYSLVMLARECSE